MDIIKNITRWDNWSLGRTDYILSLAVIVLGLCLAMYLRDYCNTLYDSCCNHELHYIWSQEIFGFLVFSVCFVVFGIYMLLILLFYFIYDSYTIYPILLFIPLVAFFVIQSIRRCYSSGNSPWCILIPMFPPVFLSYYRNKQKEEGERKLLPRERMGLIVMACFSLAATILILGANISRSNRVATIDKVEFHFHHESANAIYHWKRVLNPTEYEMDFMKKHHVKRIYVKFFDVSTDNLFNGQGVQPIPIATTIFNGSPGRIAADQIEIVPVVFITVEALRLGKPLCEKITKRVDDMCKANHIDYHEIQLDCDWTRETKESFYTLCKEMKLNLHNNRKGLSSTIRLHQLRDTLPDIDYGVLMLYNTENLSNPKVQNSILSSKVVSDYMRRARSDKHLDFAYPTYDWTLWFDGNMFKGILPKGSSIDKGEIRYEKSEFKEIIATKRILKNNLKNIEYQSSTIIYHLDSTNLSKYSYDEIEDIYRH